MPRSGASRDALLAHVAFVEATLDSLEEGIVACDADGTLVLFNEATRRFHGLPAEPLPPDRWADHYDLLDETGTRPLDTAEIPLVRALTGEVVRDEGIVIAPRAGGPRRRVRVTGQQVRTEDGTLLGAVVAMRDVTQVLAAEEEAARTREEAERLRTELVLGLSHDMRSPLASILGFTELLDDRSDAMLAAGQLPEVLDAMRRQAEHLESLVGQLLADDLTGRAAPTRVDHVDLRLDELVEEVVAAHAFTERVTLLEAVRVVVPADREAVARLVRNLVSNALRHTEGAVELRLDADGAVARVTVRDHGPGLGSLPERLFGRFVRADDASADGTGLGLYLARRIATEHGGTLDGRDAEGGGALFTLTLPCRRPPRPPADDARGRAAASSVRPQDASTVGTA